MTRSASASSPAFAVTASRSSRAARPSASRRPDFNGAIEQRGDAVASLGGCFSGLLDADDAVAGVECRDRDAGTHQAGSDHADRRHWPRRDAFEPGHLGRGALGKEDVAQRLGLIGIAQPQEGRALLGQSLRQRVLGRRLRTRRTASIGACCPRVRDSAFAAACSKASASTAGTASVAGAAQRLAGKVTRHGDCRGDQVAVHDTVDDAERQCLGRRHDAAAGDQLDRRRRPDEARQALRPAGARHDAELHFGQAELGFGAPQCDDGSRARTPGRRRVPRR